MKELQRMMKMSFMVGFLAALFYSFGLLCREWYGIGLYSFEADLLLLWIIIMFGTAFYYGIIIVMLYPEEARKRLSQRKRRHL